MKYAVVDLEMCKVPKAFRSEKYRYSQETIQIGAVLLDENYEIVGRFNTYVKPQYGQIDSFINRLTGIEKTDVKDAPIMEEALDKFLKWLPGEEVCCVSWSDSDSKQILHEIESKGIANERLEEILNSWIDCQKTFDERMDSDKAFSLEMALIAADIDAEGREHDGLSDAYNTALLFAKMQKNPEFELHPAYQAAHEGKVEHLGYSLGDMFGGLILQCAVG